MIWSAVLTTGLVVGASAFVTIDDVATISQRLNLQDRDLRVPADSTTEDLERRQASTASTTNVTAWDTQTAAACTTALVKLNGVASNPSGMSFCYNLPFLDNSTGVFQADLRLFMVASPSADFTGVPSQDISVAVLYNGATASTIDSSQLMPRDDNISLTWPSIRSTGGVEERQASVPTMAQSYAFVGQINKNLLSANLNSTDLQAILIPMVTLSAKTASGAIVNTTLSSTEAVFVTGVFSDQPKTIATAASIVASIPFILPGTQILIFPIGAIITGIWALLGIATVGYGTYGRMVFREQYRRRVLRAEKGGQRRI